jgi:hypothetical protein
MHDPGGNVGNRVGRTRAEGTRRAGEVNTERRAWACHEPDVGRHVVEAETPAIIDGETELSG